MKHKLLIPIIAAALLLAAISTIAASPSTKEAAIDKDYKTDVNAYINDCKIEAYRIDGRFFIPVEELQRFKFSVDWDENNETLNLEHIALHSAEDEVLALAPQLDFSTENTSYISGKVKLPKGTIAPKGGCKITIRAAINPAPETDKILRGNHPIDINTIYLTIPEGKNSIDYKVPVLLNYMDYKPAYFLFFSSPNVPNQKGHGNYPFTVDVSTGAKTNIDYTLGN